MAIEKLYLTDTFRVWAEKFNATIDASNTATANAEKAVKKAEEALQKAEQAVNDSVKGDDITTIVNENRQVVVKDVAIGGDVNDLASKRGQIGKDYLLTDGGDLNDLRTPGNYGVRGATWENVPEKTYARIQVMNGAIQTSGFVGGLTQLWCTIGQQYVHWFYRSFVHSTQTWSDWVKFVDETDLATTSTLGIVQPDNTTITVKDGIISAKTLGTLDGTTVVNNDFNNLTTAGRYFISTVKDTTTNAPINVTADWWIDVFTYGEGSTKKIIQEARMHSTTSSSATSGVANYLARCCTGTTWGPWEYAYTQFAG